MSRRDGIGQRDRKTLSFGEFRGVLQYSAVVPLICVSTAEVGVTEERDDLVTLVRTV